MNQQLKRKRAFVLAGNLALMLFCGLIYAWSIFVIPIEREFGWTRAQTSLTFTFSLTFSTLAAGTASFITKKIRPSRLILISAALLILGFGAASRLNSLWQLYFYYSLVCGIPVGFVYNICPTGISAWFPDKPNLITGVMLMAFGISGMVFGQIASLAIAAYGWRTAFLLFGWIGLTVLAICSFAVISPSGAEREALGYSTGQGGKQGPAATPRDMLRDRRFLFYSLFFICYYAASLGVSSQGSPMAQFIGVSVAGATTFAGVISISNGVGRVCFGRCLDSRGRAFTVRLITALSLITAILLLVAIALRLPLLLLAAFALSGFSGGGSPVLAMSIVKSRYGEKHYGVNVGIANLNIIVGSFGGPYLSGLMYQGMGGYLPVAVLVLVLSCVLLLLRKTTLD